MYGWGLEGICRMSKLRIVVFEQEVWTRQVRTGQVRTGQVKSGHVSLSSN